MRLDRMLSNAHAGTRTQVKKLVKDGRVCVNGERAPHSSLQIDENNDTITIDGNPIVYEKYVYFMLYKPAGYISATESSHEPTVMDLMPQDIRGLFPCGRLDRDTEGLLLMTNDGPLAHKLLSPKYRTEKEYYIEHALPLRAEDVQRIEKGVVYEGVQYRPAKYKRISDTACTLTVCEGKYHEIKLIFSSLNNHVDYLKRIRMKNLKLDESIKKGSYRTLTESELDDLKEENS